MSAAAAKYRSARNSSTAGLRRTTAAGMKKPRLAIAYRGVASFAATGSMFGGSVLFAPQ